MNDACRIRAARDAWCEACDAVAALAKSGKAPPSALEAAVRAESLVLAAYIEAAERDDGVTA